VLLQRQQDLLLLMGSLRLLLGLGWQQLLLLVQSSLGQHLLLLLLLLSARLAVPAKQPWAAAGLRFAPYKQLLVA
jgi:hypothetical protein